MTQNQFQNAIQQANALLQAEKTSNAYHAYRACLTRASTEQLTVSVEQLSTIWMGIGFCYAARSHWDRALQWYHLSKTAVLSTTAFTPDPETVTAASRRAKWQSYTPDGADITLDHDAPEYALGEICEAIAFAYENSDQDNHAQLYREQSVKLYRRAERATIEPELIAETDETDADDALLFPDFDPFELGAIPLGAIGNDKDALTLLQHFGIRRFGATKRKWNAEEGELQFFKKDSEEATTVSGVTLYLFGQPEQAVSVSFTMFACRIVVVEKRPFADNDEPVFVALHDETMNPQADTLIDWLDAMDVAL